MKFTIPKDQFSRLLYLTSSIVERRNTMPVLANVRIKAEGNTVSVTATDLEISLAGKIDADVAEEGSITVDAKVIYEYVKELPDVSISVQSAECERLEIHAGQARSRINGMSSDEYPEVKGLSVLNAAVVSADKIYDMLDKTAFAISMDEARFNLNGVYVENIGDSSQHKLRVVATDGHRLAFVDRESEGFVLPEGVIIPRKGIQELKKVLEDNKGVAYILVNEGFFTVSSSNVTIGIRLVDGQFPDYRKVVPVGHTSQFEISRSDLLSSLRRVSLVSDKSRAITCKLTEGNFILSSKSSEYGEASETIPVNQEGEDVTICFCARYLIDVINAMSGCKTMRIRFSGDLGPAVFHDVDDEDFTCIVMPVRL